MRAEARAGFGVRLEEHRVAGDHIPAHARFEVDDGLHQGLSAAEFLLRLAGVMRRDQVAAGADELRRAEQRQDGPQRGLASEKVGAESHRGQSSVGRSVLTLRARLFYGSDAGGSTGAARLASKSRSSVEGCVALKQLAEEVYTTRTPINSCTKAISGNTVLTSGCQAVCPSRWYAGSKGVPERKMAKQVLRILRASAISATFFGFPEATNRR